jgi:hypothetical protein
MGRELMKCLMVLMSALLLFSANASAQEEAGATSEPAAASESAPSETAPADDASATPPEEDDRSPYYKKVKGWLWIEGVAGISSYDPDQFGALNLGTGAPGGASKEKGPQWGFSLGTGFGGGFFLGWYYRQASYSTYKLMKTGLEFQPTIRIPYVHIMFRVDIGFAQMFGGSPQNWGLTNVDTGGVDTTFGVGLRIPIVRWMSFAANFDWSYIGLSVRGDSATSGRIDSWVSGQQLAGTFALTFHFIGVRKD